jgi:hypothetical protein
MKWQMFAPFKDMFEMIKDNVFDCALITDLTEEEQSLLEKNTAWLQTVQKTSTYFG